MASQSRQFLLTPPRQQRTPLTPSPRRPLFDTPARHNRAAGPGKWTAALVLVAVASVSFLAGGIAYSSSRHAAPSLAPTPIPGWGDEAGRDSSEVFFHIEPFESGLNNERISLLKAAEVASRSNWTLVLPSFKDFHAVIAGDASAAVVLPFSHFYDESAFAEHARRSGFRVARSLPPNRFHACTKMLALAATWPRALTSALMSSFAEEHRVVCLPPHAVWHAIRGYDVPDLDWSANAGHAAGGLRPSALYGRELERMVRAAADKFFGGEVSSTSSTSSSSPSSQQQLDFIAVHVRVEDDWRRVCAMGADRTRRDHWLGGDKKACLVSEAEIAERVLREREAASNASSSSSNASSSSSSSSSSLSSRRPLAFVMSAAPTSQMPRLCDPLEGALRCFTPDDVWLDPDPSQLPFQRTKLVRSYVSFLFAKEKASALFGNVHSTFSRELGDEMRARGKGVVFYNPECADLERCP